MRVAERSRATLDPDPSAQVPRGGIATTAAGAVALAVIFFLISPLLSGIGNYDVLGAVIMAPILIAFTIPILARQAKREGDKTLLTLLIAALVLKLIGAIVRYYFAVGVYNGKNDAIFYDHIGGQLADNFRAGNFNLEALNSGVSGSNFIEFATGILYTIIGPTIVGGFVFFSWLGFLGMFFFYRAFVVALPEGRSRTYAKMVFFLPSLLFWPSSIGKESWMMFTLGIAALGAAHLVSGRTFRGLAIGVIGLWGAALPRPHIAALAGLAIGGAFLLRKAKPQHRQIAPFLKLASLALVAVAAAFFVVQANDFLKGAGIDTSSGIGGALEEAADRSGKGGSGFEAPVFNSPSRAPIATFTVLFRPTIIESHNPQALLSAGEGTFLLLMTIIRFGWFRAAIRLIRKRPYVALAVLMTGFLIFAFSSLSNLGILARERVQLLPFYLVLFSVPSKKWLELRAKREAKA
ncbi:MAG: hypothetical protein ACRDJ1_02485, partial [Actinomycetota bacterium]